MIFFENEPDHVLTGVLSMYLKVEAAIQRKFFLRFHGRIIIGKTNCKNKDNLAELKGDQFATAMLRL